MSRKLMGRKRGMTRVFDEKGHLIVATVIEAEPNVITQIKTVENDGYTAIQMAFEKVVTKDPRTIERRVAKPQRGQFAKISVEPRRFISENRIAKTDEFQVGQEINVGQFVKGEFIDVTATTKGKGFQGVMKRWNFAGGRATHGNSLSHRVPGSTGMRSTPGRTLPNKKMPGHMGDVTRTVQNLEIVDIIPEENVILVKGAVPGARDSLVYIKDAVKKPKKKNSGAKK